MPSHAQVIEGVPILVIQALYAAHNGFSNVVVISTFFNVCAVMASVWRRALEICSYRAEDRADDSSSDATGSRAEDMAEEDEQAAPLPPIGQGAGSGGDADEPPSGDYVAL
jgi:hypothetical protein